MQQKLYKILILHPSMDTMSYSQMLLTVDLTSKWVLMAFGGMELVIGGLEMILTKDSLLDLHIMKKMYFVHISYLSGNGGFLMTLLGLLQEMILG